MAGKGNPKGVRLGGRQKGTPNKATADVKAAAQKYTEEALSALADIMRSGESEQARVSAANALLDRGHGKPKQDVDMTARLTIDDALAALDDDDA